MIPKRGPRPHSCSISTFATFSFSQCLFSYISSPRRIPREWCKGVPLFIFRVEVLSSALRLLMSFSWSFFPWLSGPGSFLPTVFLVFGDSIPKRCKGVSFHGGIRFSALCRSRRELSDAYLFAKFGFDTAENEPCKVCPLSAYRFFRSVAYRLNCCSQMSPSSFHFRELRSA